MAALIARRYDTVIATGLGQIQNQMNKVRFEYDDKFAIRVIKTVCRM